MRIRFIQCPDVVSVDGLRLDQFEQGRIYNVGSALGCLLLSEGWAEPVDVQPPTAPIPQTKTSTDED